MLAAVAGLCGAVLAIWGVAALCPVRARGAVDRPHHDVAVRRAGARRARAAVRARRDGGHQRAVRPGAGARDLAHAG